MQHGKDFLTIAHQLNSMQPQGAAQRSAISRAYYAAYNYARQMLRNLGMAKVADDTRNHGVVWNFFQNCGDDQFKQVGQLLANLESDRVGADYHLNKAAFDKPANAMMRIQTAQQIISELDGCMGDAARAQAIAAAMKNYKQRCYAQL